VAILFSQTVSAPVELTVFYTVLRVSAYVTVLPDSSIVDLGPNGRITRVGMFYPYWLKNINPTTALKFGWTPLYIDLRQQFWDCLERWNRTGFDGWFFFPFNGATYVVEGEDDT
jgi:hypothetical protein